MLDLGLELLFCVSEGEGKCENLGIGLGFWLE